MAIKMSQGLKQTQSLTMTPQLQQAIKLLTLTHLEMTNVIAEEMVENPMLEEFDPNNSEVDVGDSKAKEERLEMQTAEATSENFQEEKVVGKDDDFDWQSYIETHNNSSSTPNMVTANSSEELPNYENIISRGQSLAEHLEWQLRMEDLSNDEIEFALEIIHSVNDDGYLSIPFSDVIKESKLDEDESHAVWEQVKQLDPVGCACETLTDCLLSQARIAEERSPLLEKIIRDHLQDLEGRDFPKIAKELGVTADQVRDTVELLKNFHPKPGRLVSAGDTHYVVPDIYVVNLGGQFAVKVNDDGVPRLKVSKLYQQMLSQKHDKAAQDYVQEKLRSALWLIKSVQNRQRTINKVSEAIVRQQQDFFKRGPRFLKPMVLRDIANEIGMHESTVSRVTTNKYMHTPIGLFELKYFFNSGLGGKDGGMDVSSEVLKLKIKELVANEPPKKPLSDQKIAELLSRDDVKIARRTVAKYRETLGILSSSKRKVK
jgi:RNA polymerase sigma-54 factor